MLTKLLKFPQRQTGASAVEYALILGLLVIVVIAAFLVIGGGLKPLLTDVCTAMKLTC